MSKQKSNNQKRILVASAAIDGSERGSIAHYFEIGDAYYDGVEAEEWSTLRAAVEIVNLAFSRIQRGAAIRAAFATVAEAQRSFDNAHGFTLTSWISSLDGGKKPSKKSTATLNSKEKAAANRLFSHPDFLVLPSAVQKKIRKAAGF